MPGPEHVQRLLPLVREYGRLERKRTGESVTPEEFERWADLRLMLEKNFSQGQRPEGAERRQTVRLPTRMLVEYESRGALEQALIRNISRGGLFIATEQAAAVGSEITLLIRVGNDGEVVELPAEVASTHLNDRQGRTGMGCKFGVLNADQQRLVDGMFDTALDSDA